METQIFRPKARLISTIGSEIIKDNYAAVIELVKNAYDADASYVEIAFLLNGDDLIINIKDDGVGMSKDTIINKWLVPAVDDKLVNKITPKGRKVLGRKGIGRFSTGVLGDKLKMESVCNGRKTTIDINWADFEGNKFLDEVKINIDELDTDKSNGTEFVIYPSMNQKEEWNDDAFANLIKELRKTITPITGEVTDFKIVLKVASKLSVKFSGEQEIKPFPILELYKYSAVGTVVGQVIEYIFTNKYDGTTEHFKKNLGDKTINNCGKINFEFMIFDRDANVLKEFARNDVFQGSDGARVSKKDIINMLDDVCGVFIYRNHFRIRPYGDVDFDWLNLDKERVQNPSMRIGANQLFGIIKIEEEERSNLIEKSARDGLKENDAFIAFRSIMRDIIREIENKRYSYRKQTGKGRNVKKNNNLFISDTLNKLSSHDNVKASIENILKSESISDDVKENIRLIFEKDSKVREKLVQDLHSQIAMYQGQATLGKIMDVVLHEVRKPLSWFINAADDMPVYYSEYERTKNFEFIDKILDKSKIAAEQAKIIADFFKRLDPLATKSRNTCQNINISKVFEEVFTIFRNQIQKYEIDISINCDKNVVFYGWKSDLRMTFANLIENSIYWLSTIDKDRKIFINVISEDKKLIIDIDDNGPGIPLDYINSRCIFEPGFTSKHKGGSGLGLPIAGEGIRRNGGTLTANIKNDGASFTIELPLANEENL